MYTCTSHPECSTASFGWLAYTQRGRQIVTHYYTPPLFIAMLPWVGALFPIAPDLSLAPVIRFTLSSPATGTSPFTAVESIHTVAESWGMILLSLGGRGGGAVTLGSLLHDVHSCCQCSVMASRENGGPG